MITVQRVANLSKHPMINAQFNRRYTEKYRTIAYCHHSLFALDSFGRIPIKRNISNSSSLGRLHLAPNSKLRFAYSYKIANQRYPLGEGEVVSLHIPTYHEHNDKRSYRHNDA